MLISVFVLAFENYEAIYVRIRNLYRYLCSLSMQMYEFMFALDNYEEICVRFGKNHIIK